MSFDAGTYIRMVKTAPSKNPKFITPLAGTYNSQDRDPDTSVPVEYEVTGILAAPIVEGYSILIARDSRNREPAQGTLRTSRIKGIEEVGGEQLIVTTDNSVYEITKMENPYV